MSGRGVKGGSLDNAFDESPITTDSEFIKEALSIDTAQERSRCLNKVWINRHLFRSIQDCLDLMSEIAGNT